MDDNICIQSTYNILAKPQLFSMCFKTKKSVFCIVAFKGQNVKTFWKQKTIWKRKTIFRKRKNIVTKRKHFHKTETYACM